MLWQIPDAVDTFVCAPDDGWRYHPKHVEQFPDINKLCKVASCWIYIGIYAKCYWSENRSIRMFTAECGAFSWTVIFPPHFLQLYKRSAHWRTTAWLYPSYPVSQTPNSHILLRSMRACFWMDVFLLRCSSHFRFPISCSKIYSNRVFNLYNPVVLSPSPLLKDKLLTCLVTLFKEYREAATRLTVQKR